MSGKCAMRRVVTAENKWFITAHNPETRLEDHTNFHECKLECDHYEYRRVGRGTPEHLACAACTGRKLSAAERKRRAP